MADEIDLTALHCYKSIKADRAYCSIGTLGGGNHFIEVDQDENGDSYLVIHSGSRCLGLEVTNYYLKAGKAYLQEKGCVVDFVSPDTSGRIKPKQILDLVTDKTLLVSMMHVNSETGVIQPIEEVGAALAGTKTYFHVDATQGFGKLNGSLRNAKYNMLSITAHKLGGPQGIGALIIRRDRTYRRPPVKQLMYGGQQERGYRPGTTPVALVAGFALAAELCNKEASDHMGKCKVIKQNFMEAIQGLNYTLNGDQEYCLPSTVNISFHGVDAEGIFLAVKEDYAFSNGSACNSGSHAPSYVLTAMGLDEARISEAVRISWNHNTVVDFSALVDYIKSIT